MIKIKQTFLQQLNKNHICFEENVNRRNDKKKNSHDQTKAAKPQHTHMQHKKSNTTAPRIRTFSLQRLVDILNQQHTHITIFKNENKNFCDKLMLIFLIQF